MDNIAGIPYSMAQFDQDGKRLVSPVLPAGAREIIIVSHGWNNNRGEAESLYKTLFENVAAVHPKATQGLAIVGVIWPSKKFDLSDDAPAADNGQDKNLVAAASMSGQGAAEQQRSIEAAFAKFEQVFEDSPRKQELPKLRALLGQLEQPAQQTQFVLGLRRVLDMPEERSDLDASSFFFEVNDARDVFKNAEQASSDVDMDRFNGGGEISGAGIGDVFSGVGTAVSSLLNITTYYEMKKRAGNVGSVGLGTLIDELAQQAGVERIHLVGHSFGARLVTAAAMHSKTPKLHSMFLLQGAFSHNAFAPFGYFRKVLEEKRLTGPILITHTRNDKAVGKAYAIASRISRDSAAGLGDANDKYGGLGRNGAVSMQPMEVSRDCTVLLDSGAPYILQSQLIHNLESSQFIKDHGDVAGRQVAWAISCGIAQAGGIDG
jgi:hypothetical protein